MKMISWNVNGIRACIKKGFLEFLEEENPDIIGIQETKGRPEQVEKEQLDKITKLGYKQFWNPAERPGYSGTAVFSKTEPISVYRGIETENMGLTNIEIDEVIEENHEGRVTTLEFEGFYFITVYTPNSKRDLERLEYRQTWDHIFLKYMKFLEQKKPVIVCGDLNVAHKEIDLANPKTNRRNAGFTDEERSGMTDFVNEGFIDTYRNFYPDQVGAYSWWSYFGKARDRNVGWRIDYFLSSNSIKEKLKDAFILPERTGSDHCPVGLILK